ncbi:MAG: hypothetical protein U9Q03_03670 [Patescibacteria group bacterium]|nr:hypothetical protein [Patescibacteria group bacterium]
MNIGTERTAIESLFGSFASIRLEWGQRFADKDGTELHLAGISRGNIVGGDRGGPVVVLSAAGLKEGVERPPFVVVDCVGMVVIRSQTADERAAEGIAPTFASRYVVEVVRADVFDVRGRCIVRETGASASYPLLMTAGVND